MSFRQCKRRFAWAYVNDLSPDDRVYGALPLGSRVHSAIEVHHAGGDGLKEHDRLARIDVAYLETNHRPPWEKDELYHDIIVGRNCVSSYLEWLVKERPNAGYTMIGNEKMIEVPFCDGRVTLRGKMDRLWQRDSDGSIFIEDVKTTSVYRAGLRERLERSYQPYIYLTIEQELNPEFWVAGAWFTTINKVANKKRVKDAIVERFNVPGVMSVLPTKVRQLEQICREALECVEAVQLKGAIEAAWPNVQEACRWCPFRIPCEVSDEDPASAEAMLDAEYRRGYKHARYDERVLSDVVA
jgi:RecB family exonuclease